MKHSANRAVVAGKRIVLVDDSIVRGTTSRKIVQMMRDAGAREVHFRIASPPITHPDYYGIDTPERDKLLAATHDLEGMKNIGHDGSRPVLAHPPGPNCAVTYRCGAPKAKPKAAIVNISAP